MSTATRATGSRSLTAWSFGPFATVPSYQNRGRAYASVKGEVAAGAEAEPRRCGIVVAAPGATV
jgi:hypothetical protein